MSGFRRAAEADLPRIMEIIAQAQAYLAAQGIDQWQDGYPDEAIMGEDIRLGQGYVLEEDGAILGIATIVFGGEPSYEAIYEGAWTTPEPYGCVHRIAVDSRQRGKGAADRIMRAAEEIIAARGITSVRIDTHRDNVVMQGMLRRNGYSPCGVIYLQEGKEQGAARVALEKHITGK